MSTSTRFFAGVLAMFAFVGTGLALLHFGIYGLTIFVLSPMVIGGLASWIRRPATGARAAGVGTIAVLAALALFFLLGREGILCIMMALPLALPMGAFGGWLVYRVGSTRLATPSAAMFVLLSPASILWDAKAPPPVYEVRTAIEIAATPEQVWKHVVAFSELPEPREWFFRAGIAYPKRARIEGWGPGAIRYCEFSTGPFVEPIEVWDEPRLLRFRVTENPAPMREWSFYAHVLPRHLHGYMISQHGQFLLTPLPNNRTLLEGTTWYRHGLWPAEYWRWWSDAIIHRIHLRVLNYIRALAEKDAADDAFKPPR
ncbi:MAG: SRPBCC family protein [Bryobacteraceae bacterium]